MLRASDISQPWEREDPMDYIIRVHIETRSHGDMVNEDLLVRTIISNLSRRNILEEDFVEYLAVNKK